MGGALGLTLLAWAGPAAAASMRFVIDIGIAESISDNVAPGHYRGAGSFSFDRGLVPKSGTALISWAQIGDFSLDLSPFALSVEQLHGGSCISSERLPVCGLLFSDRELLGVVGQYSIPDSLFSHAYNMRFDNTSPSLFDTDELFQSASIEDLSLGFVVAGGSLTTRPIPEPSSVIVFSLGALLVGAGLRRRARYRSSSR